MSVRRLVLGLLVTALATAALGWLARAPWDPPGHDAAVLRLSWRMRSAGTEVCRPRTQAELEALPAHMRTLELCERQVLSYRLVLQLDDAAPDTLRVLPGGIRRDRPAFVLNEIRIAPAAHRVRVRFEQDGGSGSGGGAGLMLAIDTVLHARAGRVELITLDADAARLVHRTAPSAPTGGRSSRATPVTPDRRSPYR